MYRFLCQVERLKSSMNILSVISIGPVWFFSVAVQSQNGSSTIILPKQTKIIA